MKKQTLFIAMILSTLCMSSAYAGEWKQNATGYWYQEDDGSNPAAAWKQIDGKWYYFTPSGYMNTGWIKVSNQWYYCESSGEMRTTDLVTDVFTFRFNVDGSCLNFYENTTPSTQAGWSSYGTSSLETWTTAILKGDIIFYDGQYWATPDYTSSLKNATVTYQHDVSGDDTTSNNRYGLSELDLETVETESDYDLDGIN